MGIVYTRTEEHLSLGIATHYFFTFANFKKQNLVNEATTNQVIITRCAFELLKNKLIKSLMCLLPSTLYTMTVIFY